MRKMQFRAALVAFAVLFLEGPATAAVTYTFTALSAQPAFIDWLDVTIYPSLGSFTYTSPYFISSALTLSPSQLDSCTSTPDPCGTQVISPSSTYDTISFDDFANYYFQSGALGADGTYDTVIFGSTQAGTLTVSGAPDPISQSAVPEPTTWAMMLMGFSAFGAAMYRSRKTRLVQLA